MPRMNFAVQSTAPFEFLWYFDKHTSLSWKVPINLKLTFSAEKSMTFNI